MAKGRVTAETVGALFAGSSDHFLWDDKLPGFGVKVTPAGAKVYVLQYRMGGRGHKTKRYTIGKEGQFRALSARKEAERLIGLVRQGVDIAVAATERKRVAVDLAFKPYLEKFAETTLKAKWPKSYKMTKRRLELHVVPTWENRPLPDITAEDVRRILRKLDEQPATRRNVFAALSFLFNRSVKDGVIQASPMTGIDPPSPVADRDRTLTDDELRWLWDAKDTETDKYAAVVEHLILWGQRRSEVADLPWAELNRDRAEWHLPARRAKNGCENVVPLTERVIANLDRIAGGEKWPRTGLVFPSREGTPISGFSKMKARLDKAMRAEAKKEGVELERWTLHDLRRTLATNMQRLGVKHEVIEHLLNHREKARTGIAKVYQTHDFKPEKLAALQMWERRLDQIIQGSSGVVVPFERRA